MPQLPEKIIDFHVHLFPDRLLEAIRRKFAEDYMWEVVYQLNSRECIDYLSDRKVSHLVYSNYAHKQGVAEKLNEWNIKLLDEFPNLYCFCAYHPDDDNSLEMARKLLRHPRVLGFKLQLLVQRFYPHDSRLFPLYEMIIEKQKRVLLHVGTGPIGNEFVGVKQFKQLMDAYPELRVNVAHMGAMEYQEFTALLDVYPNMYLDTAFAFFTDDPGAFNSGNECLEKYRDRIVYGSDFPNLIFPREMEILNLLDLNLSQKFYNGVFRENGLRLLGV